MHLICKYLNRMVFVMLVSVQLAASGSSEQNSVRAKIFIKVDGEFHRNFFAHKQLHFVLLMLFKATDKGPFTQLFVLM